MIPLRGLRAVFFLAVWTGKVLWRAGVTENAFWQYAFYCWLVAGFVGAFRMIFLSMFLGVRMLYVWLEKRYGVVCLPRLQFESASVILQQKDVRILERGIFCGIFFGLILCASFGYYSLRDKTFLWYIIQLVASMLTMQVEGLLVFLGVHSDAYYTSIYHLSLVAYYAASLVFAQYYLDTVLYHPRFHRLFTWLARLLVLGVQVCLNTHTKQDEAMMRVSAIK